MPAVTLPRGARSGGLALIAAALRVLAPVVALYLLKELGFSGEEVPAALSSDEGRRAALARALAPSPDIHGRLRHHPSLCRGEF